MSNHDNESHRHPAPVNVEKLVTVESQREFDLLSGERAERTFLKLYVAARTSGLLAAISDRDWKTLCTLATYMDADGYCFPSQAELARALGCSRQMANERIKSLAAFRFQSKPVLLVERDGRSKQGTWTRNGYHILPIANLGIFDDATQRAGDGRKANRPKWAQETDPQGKTTVSRNLDTVAMSRDPDTVSGVTVSSQTVPVELDTNKNHRTNEISLSNIRKAEPSFGNNLEPDPGASPKRGGNIESLGETLSQRASKTGRDLSQHDPDRDVIVDYLADFSREFSDRAPLKSSTTRAYNLYLQSGLPLETFVDGLYRARSIVKERTAVIRVTDQATAGAPAKNKMAYFFAVLEDLLGLREHER